MNGFPVQIWLWVLAAVGAVFSAGAAFIGFILTLLVKEHIKRDEEAQRRIELVQAELKTYVVKTLEGFEIKLHNYGNKVNEIVTRLRWEQENKEHK